MYNLYIGIIFLSAGALWNGLQYWNVDKTAGFIASLSPDNVDVGDHWDFYSKIRCTYCTTVQEAGASRHHGGEIQKH